MVRAVRATYPNPNSNYRLADGSAIPNSGYMYFVGVAEEGFKRASKASVTDVDRPLLSVAQVVQNGGKVVFSKDESYIEMGAGRRDQLEFRNGLYVLKLWVPRDQKMDFHGQA